MNFTTLAKERYSCRKISSRPIESEKLEELLSKQRLQHLPLITFNH